jgi:peroxiredoxin
MLAGFASNAPAHIVQTFRNERDRFDAFGVPADIPAIGSPLPEAELLDVHGNTIRLSEARGGKPAVIVFYRGAWCPFCNIALRTYQAELVPALDEMGIVLIAISPQKPDGSLSMQQINSLTFTVASDPGNQLAGKLGILSPSRSEEARAASAALGADVAAANADGTDAVPMPTTIVVDVGGTIAWIDVHANYTTRSEVAQILAAARRLGATQT